MRTRGDSGETLIEVLFTIVIVSLTFSALFTALATAGNAGNVQRTSVQSDVVLRNYAEATKAAAQDCVYPGTYTVTYPPPLPTGFKLFVVEAGIDVAEIGLPRDCPGVTTAQTLTAEGHGAVVVQGDHGHPGENAVTTPSSAPPASGFRGIAHPGDRIHGRHRPARRRPGDVGDERTGQSHHVAETAQHPVLGRRRDRASDLSGSCQGLLRRQADRLVTRFRRR